MFCNAAIIITLLTLPGVVSDSCGEYARDWRIPGHMKTDICCNNVCPPESPAVNINDETHCCSCNSKPKWLLNYPPALTIEYTSVMGSSVLISTLPTDTKIYQVTHTNMYLRILPDNICDFDGIVKLNLDDNKIKALPNLKCLKRLDTISLARNRITVITNDTFIGMSFLRVLDLSGNRIRVLDQDTFSDKSIAIQWVNFADNDLQEVDITNGIIDKPFCEFDYSNNKINDVTNYSGFKFEANETYGFGGVVLLRGNFLTHFIDFKKIGLDDIRLLGKVLSYGFDLAGTNITCDCTIEPFLELSYGVLVLIWRDYDDVRCYNPPSLRDVPIASLINASKFDLFICNMTHADGCPVRCHCTAKPYLNITVVKCSSVGLTKLPYLMPSAENLAIDLSGNNITRLEHRDYLNKTTEMNVAFNSINDIDTQALDAMRNIGLLNITGNRQLESIPEAMKQIQPCSIDLTGIYLECDCSNTWIGKWYMLFNKDNCEHSVNQPVCKTTKGNRRAEDTTADFLECEDSTFSTLTIVLAVCVSICVGLATFVHYFRYELAILFRNVNCRLSHQSVKALHPFDVYISSQDPSDDLRSWIRNYLVSNLERSGYKVCLPYRDFEMGCIRSEEIIKMLNMSKNIIVIASDDYFNEEDAWAGIEWSHAYRRYRSREIENIIIINYDHMKTTNVTDRRMKAFFRLRMPLDFSSYKHSLVTNIKQILGWKANKCSPGFGTARPKFDPSLLWTKCHNRDLADDVALHVITPNIDTSSVSLRL